MTAKKGLVIEAGEGWIVVLFPAGEQKKIKTGKKFKPGGYYRESNGSMIRYAGLAVAFILILLMVIDFFNVQAYAAVNGVTMGINRWDRVASTSALDEQEAKIIEDMALTGKPVQTAMGMVVDKMLNRSLDNGVKNTEELVLQVEANGKGQQQAEQQIIELINQEMHRRFDEARASIYQDKITAMKIKIEQRRGNLVLSWTEAQPPARNADEDDQAVRQQAAPADGAAYTIQVSADMEDTTKILGKTAGEPGNGSIASAMAGLKTQGLAGLGGKTINSFYTDQAADLGLEVQKASNYSKDHDTLAKSLSDQRDSLTGVSMDEEAANLVKAQRAFEAASRLVSVMDDMLDKVINGMGMVGR